jgi:hypothetical protein
MKMLLQKLVVNRTYATRSVLYGGVDGTIEQRRRQQRQSAERRPLDAPMSSRLSAPGDTFAQPSGKASGVVAYSDGFRRALETITYPGFRRDVLRPLEIHLDLLS